MKKILFILLIFCIFLTGCTNYNQKNVEKKLSQKISNASGYKLTGNLTVSNNDDVYNYDVVVEYKKDNYYKVKFTNINNDHTQVILKNDTGVYVITPSLNKSFRFQSDWPYDNSQIYLLTSLLNDIKRDSKKVFNAKNNMYLFETVVKYPNNSKLVKQKIFFNKNMDLEKVIVYDDNNVECMTMVVDKIKYSPKFSKNNFDVDNIISKNDLSTETEKTGSLDDVIYPLFLPSGTKLVSEEKVSKDNGERVIMNYDGEKSFLLVEETADIYNELTIIPTFGEPYRLMDTLGVMTENSLSWTSDGVDFYIVSDVMSKDEMVEVAQSITGVVSIK